MFSVCHPPFLLSESTESSNSYTLAFRPRSEVTFLLIQSVSHDMLQQLLLERRYVICYPNKLSPSRSWIMAPSVQFSCSVVSDSLRPHELQHARLPCPSPTHGAYSNSCPLSWWCHPTFYPLSSPSPPDLNLFQHQGIFKWVSSSHQVAKVLEFQLQHQSFQWLFRVDFL